MQQELLIAIFSGLGAMLGWGFADFFAKKTIDEIGDLATIFWAQFIGIFPLAALFLVNSDLSNFTLQKFDPFITVLFGVVSAVSYDILYKAFGKGEVSILSPIFASYAGVVVLLSAFFFGEQIPVLRWLALGVIFIGILITCVDPKSIINSFKKTSQVKGLPEVITALIMFSLWLVFWSNFVGDKSWILILFVRIVAAFTLLVMAHRKGISLMVNNRKLWKFLIFIGIFDVMAFSLVSVGFSATPHTSIIAMLSGAFSLPTIILAHIFLKEKATIIQTVGGLTIIAGIVFLSLN